MKYEIGLKILLRKTLKVMVINRYQLKENPFAVKPKLTSTIKDYLQKKENDSHIQ